MRLLVLTPEFASFGGGIGRYYRTLLPELARVGCDVRVMVGSATECVDAREERELNGIHYQVVEQDRVRNWERRLGALAPVPFVRSSIAASWAMWEQTHFGEGFDVVEAADFGMAFVAPIVQSKVPVILQMHGSQGQIAVHDPVVPQSLEGPLALAIETAAARCATAVQTSSAVNAAYWSAQSGRSVDRRLPAWPLSQGNQNAPEARARLSVFGRVQRWKGPHILCDALRILGDRAPVVDWYGRDTWIDVPGQTTSGWLFREYPDVWGSRIVWHPQIPAEQVARVQSSSLLNIVPSTWDVFNFTAVEAMASGRPLICSASAGASALLQDGVTGFVYGNNSPAELAAALQRALSLTEAQKAAMGVAARRAVVTHLDPDTIAAERMACYRAVVAEPQSLFSAPDWFRNLCSPPSTTDLVSDYAHLDQHPLKALVTYTAERALRKLVRR